MNNFKKILKYVRKNKYLSIIVLIIVIVLFIFVLKKNNSQVETVRVAQIDFINQVSVSGRVIPSENVDLGFYQGGRVASVRARIGEYVSYGSIIANIENGDLRAALEQRQAALAREQVRLKSLQMGTRPEQIKVTESSVASAEMALSQSKQSLINAISDSYTKSDDAIKGKIDQFFQNPFSDNPFIVLYVNDTGLISEVGTRRAQVGKLLISWEKSLQTINSETDLTKYIVEAQKNMEEIKIFIARVSQITNNKDATYNGSTNIPSTWKTDTSTARLSIDSAISSFSTVVTSYKNAQTALTTAKNTLELEKAGATAEDIQVQEAQVKAAEADVINAEAMLEKTLIIAPFSGQITKMDAKVGETASPNVPLVSMMSSGTFQIESYIPEVNIAKIRTGQEADVTLDAYGDEVFFKAKVIAVDPAETVKDGVSNYKTKLQFIDKDERIRSGMTANASVIIFKKPNSIVLPEGVIYEKDGKNFVQVKNEKNTLEKEVITGERSSLGQVEILSGVAIGEEVVLKPKNN